MRHLAMPTAWHKDTQEQLRGKLQLELAGSLQRANAGEGKRSKTPITAASRQPAQHNQQTAASASFSVVGADHSAAAA